MDLMFSFCSQPVDVDAVPDLGGLEEGQAATSAGMEGKMKILILLPQVLHLKFMKPRTNFSMSQILTAPTVTKSPNLNPGALQVRDLKGSDLGRYPTAAPHYREGKVLWGKP
ncbi:hypothetical protein VPH35_074268 [Triticum aestivum]